MLTKHKDPTIVLHYILESIEQIEEYITGLTLQKFRHDELTKDAVILRLAVIGESVKRLPTRLRSATLEIPWKKIAGMRDVLIHDYMIWDLALIWHVAKKDLPKFKQVIRKLLDDQDAK